MKKRTAWVLVAGVAAVAIGAAAVGALALVLRGRGTGTFSGNAYLYVDLENDIPEQPPSSDLGTLLERHSPSLRTLVSGLDRAAADPKVKSVVLRIATAPDTGWGKIQELRDAITRFRKSGKPAYAQLELCGNKEYYLATACSRISAVPTSILDITGLASEVTFFRGTLDKLGVQAQFEGVGKYKNAPNQFTEKGFTEPHREQMDALLDSIYAQYVRGVTEGRKKSAQEVQALLDGGPYDAAAALKAGLVDELVYQDQLDDRMKDADKVTAGRYARSSRGFGFDSRPKLALIYAVGEIIPGDSQQSPFGGSFAGSDSISSALRQARDDGDIKAVVLRVDSPGGSGTASDVIWREVQLTRKKKPLVVSMGDVAASGGYYIAMGSDAIVAQPGTITGSIGVFGGKFSLRGLYEKLGITEEILTRGRHADLFTAYRPWDDEERKKVHALMESFYVTFVTKAAEGRKKSYQEIDALAQGRVWTGSDALQRGLVDQLGGLDAALEVAKDKAHIAKSQEVRLVVLPERKGVFETLLERQEEGVEGVPSQVQALFRWATVLGDGRPLARLPFDLKIR